MNLRALLSVSTAAAIALPGAVVAETFRLDPIRVEGTIEHPSETVRNSATRAFNEPRTRSSVNGTVFQNLNPVNQLDALRLNTTGLINGPGAGDRFGGTRKVRTFGDFGAAESIDGLPAFRAADEEGGGYGGTLVPSIAIEQVDVVKGGRAVSYGDGTDGGVIETTIKSGRGYKDHVAASLDASTANEAIGQVEAASGTENGDYYVALSGFHGNYNDDPANLDRQSDKGAVTKLGWNFGGSTRAELLGIYDRTKPYIFRNGNREMVRRSLGVVSGTIDHAIDENTSVRGGHFFNDGRTLWDARNRDRSLTNHITFVDGYRTQALSETVDYAGSIGAERKFTNNKRDKTYDSEFNDYAVKWSNAFTFEENLTLTAGFRNTWFNNTSNTLNGVEQADNLQTDSLFSYEAGAAYNVLDSTRVRGSVASGYNRFFSKYGNFGNDVFNPAGAQDRVVESMSYEIGVNHGWSGGSADLAVYMIEQENVPRRNGGQIQNVDVEQSGLEFEVNWLATDKLQVSGGYMHIFEVDATREDGTPANNNIFFGSNGVPVPRNQMNVRFDYRASKEWSFWGLGYYNTGYESVNKDGSTTSRRPFTRVDLGTAWRFVETAALRFRVENVFDEKDFGATVDTQAVVEAGKLGRVFWVGLDYTF